MKALILLFALVASATSFASSEEEQGSYVKWYSVHSRAYCGLFTSSGGDFIRAVEIDRCVSELGSTFKYFHNGPQHYCGEYSTGPAEAYFRTVSLGHCKRTIRTFKKWYKVHGEMYCGHFQRHDGKFAYAVERYECE